MTEVALSPPLAGAQPLLAVEHLEVRYGDLIGVADVSLTVPEGAVVALLGSNGAGKTTTLNALAGLLPSKGTIQLAGERIDGRPAYAIVRRGLALSPEGWRLFVAQSVENNLRLGATPLHDRARISALTIGSMRCSRALPSGGVSAPARCPAASGRCSPSAAR